MAATLQVPSGLDTSTTDAMDLHSENELDFDDGDIELDLQPAPYTERVDDDVLITDAVTDTNVDVRSTAPDQDDYMVDNEDVIEEDAVLSEEPPTEDTALAGHSVDPQGEVSAPPDEDLIDYLDDDEQQFPDDSGAPSADHFDTFDAQQNDTSGEGTVALDTAEAYQFLGENQNTHEQDFGDGYDFEHEANVETSVQVGDGANEEAGSQTDDHAGGVPLQDVYDEDDDEVSHEEQQHVPEEPRPITINYEGNELWLFKEHDTEESGDWLLEDNTILTSSLSSLLQVCRSALGEDISPETELGLRFDHLHNMELFEDNTACVAVSLERLTSLYYTLHAQDGNNDPESFYMSLLSRPRFATLLSDVAKYAEEGNGYSGLTSAVEAGETHFPETHSGHSTEHENTEYENEGEEDSHEETQSPSGSEQSRGNTEPQEEVVKDKKHGEEDQDEDDDDEEHEETDSNTSAHIEQHGQHEQSLKSPAHTNADADEAVDQGGQSTEAADREAARKEQEANDTVDYSDDDEDADEDRNGAATAPSQSSSTVRGDGSVPAEASPPPTESVDVTNNQSTEIEDNTGSLNYEQFDDPIGTDSYDNLVQSYEVGETQSAHGNGEEYDYSEANIKDHTNEEYVDYEYENLDGLQDDFTNGADYDGHGASLVENDLNNTTDFLEYDNAADWQTDQQVDSAVVDDGTLTFDEHTVYYEEEDESAEQAAVADTLLPSEDTSSQGLKRSIDEVDDTVHDPSESSDTKRPRV